MNNRTLIIEEVRRMHQLMGVKSTNPIKLLKEDIGGGIAKFIDSFGKAAAKGDEVQIKRLINSLTDDERKVLDDFLRETGAVKGVTSMSDLAKLGKIDAFNAFSKAASDSSAKIGDSILKIAGNWNNLPTVVSRGLGTVDNLYAKLMGATDADDYIKNFLKNFKEGNASKYTAAEVEGLAVQVRKLSNLSGLSDTDKKIINGLADDMQETADAFRKVDSDFGTSGTGKKGKYSDMDIEDVDFEDVTDAGARVGDETGAGARVGDETGAGARVGDETGTGARTGEPEPLFAREMDEAGEYTSAEQLRYAELERSSDEEIQKILRDLANFRNTNKTGEISSDGLMVLDIARNRNLITEDDYLKIVTPYDKAGWTDYFSFARKTKERQKGKIVNTKINPFTGREEQVTAGMKIDDRLLEIRNEMGTVTDPKIKEKLRGEQLELEGLRDDDFEKYLQGLSLKNDIPITSNYPGFALKTLGSKKLSTVLDFVETGVGKYGTKKTAKWWANFALAITGLGLVNILGKTYLFTRDVVNLVAEKTGLDEFATINRLVDWSKLSEPKISVNGTKISACPGNNWCGTGISKTQFKLIDSSIGIFVTKTPLNGENYIYKFVPTDLTDFDKDYVIVVPKDSGSLSVEMKTAINEYIKQATGKDYYTAQELNKKSTTTTATGPYTEDATGALKWAKTLNSNITEVKNLVKGKTDDDGTVNYTATLVLPAGPVDGYNLKFKNGNWSKG